MLKSLLYETTSDTDVINITADVAALAKNWDSKEGLCYLFCPGSTASLSTIEYEPGAVQDLKDALERLFPSDAHYHHEEAWHDGNGYSHVRAAFMKPGLGIPLVNQQLLLGTWQQIILIDFDNKPRQRKVWVQFLPAE